MPPTTPQAAARHTVRRLRPDDLEAFRAIRSTALQKNPTAYATSAEEWNSAPDAAVAAMLNPEQDAAVFGVWTDGLIGMVGLKRDGRSKARHKGTLWGFYVEPGADESVARALIEAIMRYAAQLNGMIFVRVLVTTTHEAEHTLFEELGFRVYGREERSLLVDGVFCAQAMLARDL